MWHMSCFTVRKIYRLQQKYWSPVQLDHFLGVTVINQLNDLMQSEKHGHSEIFNASSKLINPYFRAPNNKAN